MADAGLVSGNMLYGYRWKDASRWWGTVRDEEGSHEMEFDVVAESVDGKALLVGECKWTNPEIAGVLIKKLKDKASKLPYSVGKEIILVLFLKNRAKDNCEGFRILYPEDIIRMAYGEA